jgi:transposase
MKAPPARWPTRLGHDHDRQKGLPIIVYGLLTNRAGCPVAVQVYPGNTADPNTVLDQVDKLRQQFHLERWCWWEIAGC